ncbi:MAG: integrin alpha, partial [Bacteroidota bacterium]|nr:integrin alpha [Bacteroidota bacterium]
MIQILFLLPAALLFALTVLNQPLETDNLFSAESRNYAKPEFTTQSGFEQLMPSNISKDNKEVENIKNTNNINIDKNWFDNTIRDLKNDEYNISYNELLGLFQSPNRSNNIRFIYHNDGFSAKTRENKIPLFDVNDKSLSNKERKYKTIPEWEIRFKLNGYTKTENDEYKNLVLFSGDDLIVNKNKASIEDNNVRIDFTNDAEGMRQDFIIKNQISGEGKLKVKLSTETNLSMNVNEDVLNFKDQNGNEKMRYASLKVWDSQGKILKAYFEKSSHQLSDQNISDAKNNSIISKNVKQFCIVVDDENAVYPITIDPISTSPNWITDGNQVQAGYGYSVSSAGDVNNDGYSDVIIGALFYDNGQTNEGKVFAYNGTSAGLLTVALWTAEGNQADAQFGNSV